MPSCLNRAQSLAMYWNSDALWLIRSPRRIDTGESAIRDARLTHHDANVPSHDARLGLFPAK